MNKMSIFMRKDKRTLLFLLITIFLFLVTATYTAFSAYTTKTTASLYAETQMMGTGSITPLNITIDVQEENASIALPDFDIYGNYTLTLENCSSNRAQVWVDYYLEDYTSVPIDQVGAYVEYIQIKLKNGASMDLAKENTLISDTLDPGEVKTYEFSFNSTDLEDSLDLIEGMLQGGNQEDFNQALEWLRLFNLSESFTLTLETSADYVIE